jgi:Icc-related predicted phosphoesterase
MKIVAISDTHNRHSQLVIPECDVLIHAGDATGQGYPSEVRSFARWFNNQPAKHKIFVPGNHEFYFESELPASKLWFQEECPDGILLIEQEIVIDGIKFYGSPITPRFFDWAWNRDRFRDIKPHWDTIPNDVNVLITHGPPFGVLDIVYYVDGITPKERVGCVELWERILELKQLKVHLFGHIHSESGEKEFNGIRYFNCSVCDEMYMPVNGIKEFEI